MHADCLLEYFSPRTQKNSVTSHYERVKEAAGLQQPMKMPILKSGHPQEEAPNKYLFRGAQSKVIHYRPSSSCSI
eukprot:631642-Pelagomonas_calceolata.AAC.2